MLIEIKEKDTPESINKKLEALFVKVDCDEKERLNKFFGALHIKEDAVSLQRRWRDE
jgi:hypothetical protein